MAWAFDANNSCIIFAVRHAGVANIRGRFRTFNVSVDFDEQEPTHSSIEVEVDTASIDTNVEFRDNHLRSPEYLDVERFPTMTYRSRSAEPVGEGLRVVGDLTLHGVTREVALVGEFGGVATDPRGFQRAGFTFEVTLNRRDFDMLTESPMPSGGVVVGDLVTITIEAELSDRPPAPPPA